MIVPGERAIHDSDWFIYQLNIGQNHGTTEPFGPAVEDISSSRRTGSERANVRDTNPSNLISIF